MSSLCLARKRRHIETHALQLTVLAHVAFISESHKTAAVRGAEGRRGRTTPRLQREREGRRKRESREKKKLCGWLSRWLPRLLVYIGGIRRLGPRLSLHPSSRRTARCSPLCCREEKERKRAPNEREWAGRAAKLGSAERPVELTFCQGRYLRLLGDAIKMLNSGELVGGPFVWVLLPGVTFESAMKVTRNHGISGWSCWLERTYFSNLSSKLSTIIFTDSFFTIRIFANNSVDMFSRNYEILNFFSSNTCLMGSEC